MNGLNQFLRFDLQSFLQGKSIKVIGCRVWKDYNSKAVLGTAVDCLIDKDETAYRPGKDGKVISNAWEKITIKVPMAVSVPAGVYVSPVNAVGTIYGDYRNLLSIKAENLHILGTTNADKA